MNRKHIVSGLSLAALTAASSCSSDSAKETHLGDLNLALTIDGDYEVSSVDVAIESQTTSPSVSRTRTLNTSDANSAISATEGGLPEGEYTVRLSATVVDDPTTLELDESEIACEGSVSGIRVTPGQVVDADLVLVCTLDGGQVQSAGAIRITASTRLDVVNDCPDLIGELFIGTLQTSVGGSIELIATPATGVGAVEVKWEASHGTVSPDGSAYTCPDVAGVYDLTGTFTRDGECQQTLSETITCHSSYTGPVETLPTAFAMEGTCGGRSPCHLEQDGKNWNAVCGNRPDRLTTFGGEANGENDFPFIYGTHVCHGSVVGGELVATCADGDGDICDIASDSSPPPDAYCPQLESASNIQVCSGNYSECSVAQDRCDVLIKCGDTYLGRDLNANGTVRLNDRHDGVNYFCLEETVDGVAAGTCTPTGSGTTTCDYSAEYTYVESACEETMTDDGFILEGCGFDDYCVGVQSGCGWSLVCSAGRYTGVATNTNSFIFTGPEGLACSASVVDGVFAGSCENACTFAPRAAAGAGEGCMALPSVATVNGCTFNNSRFEIIQDGCQVGGVSHTSGEAFAGVATATGISFPGDAGYQCEVSVSEDPNVMTGRCLPPVEGQRICNLTVALGE